jgi:tetratricopeptide (TPR) repeat protein
MWNRALFAAAAGLLTLLGSSQVLAQSFYLRHRPANRPGPSATSPPLTGRALPKINPPPPDEEDERPDPLSLKLRAANAPSLARARQFLEYGDARFRRQEVSAAFQRYRKAAEAAPNLADAYFRQALAQAAQGRYQPAVKSIQRGLAIAPDWPDGEFRLSQLYGDSLAAKQAHFEQLALAAEKEPDNGELFFLLGVEVLLDGQPARAKTFLRRAAELGLEGELVGPFLEVASQQAKRRPKGVEL